jgi:hypothetical protein
MIAPIVKRLVHAIDATTQQASYNNLNSSCDKYYLSKIAL